MEKALSTSKNLRSVLPADTILQDRYRIVRLLGRGGMGAVYEAVDQRLGITIALKETLSAEESVRKQFEQEARLLARLQHPALPRVSDHFSERDRAFLVMQFIAGVDLAKIIVEQPGPFPRDQVVAWADQLLDALIYLHSQDRQVIHRDIKPHNLKLTGNGQIALLDFGLARTQTADASSTSSRPFFGYTRQYAPLEQIQDLATGPQSDIYALGATLYYLLTGTKPVDALTRAAALTNNKPDPLKPADEIQPSVGKEIATILNKAMAQQPQHRYESAAAFREALRRVGRVRNSEQPGSDGPQESDRAIHTAPETTVFKSYLEASPRAKSNTPMLVVLLVLLTAVAAAVYTYQSFFTLGATVSSSQKHGDAEHVLATAAQSKSSESVETALSAPMRSIDRRNKPSGETNKTTESSARGAAPRPAQLRIPGIRLPNAEIREYSPLSAEPRLPSFGSPATSTNIDILRAPDGSIRSYRPGERVSPAIDSQK